MIGISIALVGAVLVGVFIGRRSRGRPRPVITWQPSQYEREQFAQFMAKYDEPAVTRRRKGGVN